MAATLYEQINDSIAAVADWTDTTWRDFYWLGAILSQRAYTDFDTLIAAYAAATDWEKVATVKVQCEIIGHASAAVNTAVEAFLTGRAMFTDYALPKNADPNFTIGYNYELHGYRWAQELDHETAKWDALSGYNGLHTCYANYGAPFYLCNPDAGTATALYGPTEPRLYECNQLAKSFYILWKGSNIAAAKADFLNVLVDEQGNYQTTPPHYAYNPGDADGWVWDGVPEMMQVFGRYHYGTAYSDYFSRIPIHLDGGYLTSGYDSPHWREDTDDYEFIVHLHNGNPERRMRGQFLAYVLLNQCYPIMTDTQQETFRGMLSGTGHTQAWVNMKNATAAMFNAGTDTFKLDSTDGATSDYGTAMACVLMLMQGVRPADTNGGSLAIPLRTLSLGSLPMVDPECFRWDGATYTVRIPVFKGNLTFMYNTTLTYTFPVDGVYEVTFNSDYTQIANVTQIGNLPVETYCRAEAGASTIDPSWGRMMRQFGVNGMTASVSWMPLTLDSDKDPVTGWYPKSYGSAAITVLVVANGASFGRTGAGSFTVQTYTMYSDEAIHDGDRVVYNGRYYELRNVQPFYRGDKLQCMKAEMVHLPFGGM